MSDGQRLFELAVREGVPMHPTQWDALHPDWRAMWVRIAQGFTQGSTAAAPAAAGSS